MTSSSKVLALSGSSVTWTVLSSLCNQNAGMYGRDVRNLVSPACCLHFNLPLDSSVHIAYSTLSEYFDAVAAEAAGSAEHDVLFRRVQAAPEVNEPPKVDPVSALAPFPILRPDGGWADGGIDWYPYADNGNSW